LSTAPSQRNDDFSYKDRTAAPSSHIKRFKMLVNKEADAPLHLHIHTRPPASHPQEDSPPLPEVAAAAAADKGALRQASCLLPVELLLRLLPMLPTPKGTLPTKACVNSTAWRRDSNSKPATAAVLLLLDDDENILRIFGGWGKADRRWPVHCVGMVGREGGVRLRWSSCIAWWSGGGGFEGTMSAATQENARILREQSLRAAKLRSRWPIEIHCGLVCCVLVLTSVDLQEEQERAWPCRVCLVCRAPAQAARQYLRLQSLQPWSVSLCPALLLFDAPPPPQYAHTHRTQKRARHQ